MKCSHSDVQFCPLYLASHESDAFGCDDGHLEDGSCAVARDMQYQTQLELLRVHHPRLVAIAAWKEQAQQISDQRRRNMKAAGLQ